MLSLDKATKLQILDNNSIDQYTITKLIHLSHWEVHKLIQQLNIFLSKVNIAYSFINTWNSLYVLEFIPHIKKRLPCLTFFKQ